MANSTLPDTPPEEKNNPGQDEYEQLTRRFGNPDDKDNQPAGNPTDPQGNDTASGDPSDPRGEPTSEDLADAEENPDELTHENRVGRGYRSTRRHGKKTGIFSWSGYSPRKKWLIGLGGGILGSGLIALFIFMLSLLRLDGYLNGINQRVFGAANNAVSQRVENLFERYMVTKVLMMQTCGNKITADCKANYSKSGLAGPLFNAWQDARIENRLFQKYGLEVQSYKNPSDGKERFKIVDKAGRFGEGAGEELKIKDGELWFGKQQGGPRIFGKEWNKFLKDETRWYEVLQRRSVRKYLVRKHGVKFWCFFACNTKDNIDNAKLSAKTKLKYKLVERVIYPMSPKLGLIMDCLMSDPGSGKCSAEGLRSRGIDRNTLTDAELNEIIDSFNKNPNQRLTRILTTRLLTKILNDQASQKAVSLIPGVGMVYLAASVVDMLDQADQCLTHNCLSRFAADINSAQYLEYYTSMREANDELKAGVLSLAETGALVSQFNDGGMPAEQSLVYQAENTSNKVAASLFSGSVLAASTQDDINSTKSKYLCADGKPIPTGEQVCNEKKVSRTFSVEDIRSNKIVDGLADNLNLYRCPIKVAGVCSPGPNIIVHPLLKGINTVANTILGPAVEGALGILSHTPFIGQVFSYIESKANDLVMAFFEKVFPLPVQLDSLGREKYDGLHAGGEVLASEFNKGGYTDSGEAYGLGGKLLSDKENADATTAFLQQEDYDNSHASLIERVAGRDNPSSLLNRFAMAVPVSWGQLSSNVAQMFSDPFKNFGSIWHPAMAANSRYTINAFGIPRFGYTANDPVFSADPAIYTPQYCQQIQQNWQASKTDDPVTGIDQYSTTNPCLLEQVAVEAASSAFDQDDTLDDSGNSTRFVQGDAQQVAKQVLANTNIDLSSANFCRYCREDIQNMADGKPAYGNVFVDTNILKFLLELGQSGKTDVNSITGAGSGHSIPDSNHYSGKAIDFECSINVTLADSIGVKYGLSRNNESCTNPPPGTQPHWHYSTNGK